MTILRAHSLRVGSSQKETSSTWVAANALRPNVRLVLVRIRILAAKINVTWRHFDRSLGCLVNPSLDDLATQLVHIPGLGARDSAVIADATRDGIYTVLHTKVSRLLILELNAGRETGQLRAETSEQRWEEFLELSSQRSFWEGLLAHYPSLLSRIDTIVRNRCKAALELAQRWVADRSALREFCGRDLNELQELDLAAGDSHRGGTSVARLRGDNWRIVYKPRSLAIDTALRLFIDELADDYGSALSIHIPKALERSDYGWVEFVTHRYAEGHEQLASFYRGIGQWLALMRLLSGSDLHAENMIAQGAKPVIVDCETLFTPNVSAPPSGYGNALDRAFEFIGQSVVNSGLLPTRGVGLGWRGVDISGVGMLPGQQPMQRILQIVEPGSDRAHVGPTFGEAPRTPNHPSAQPVLAEHWPEVLRGFDELTATLQRLDASGDLRPRLHRFEDCRIRVVPRGTEVYAEIGRMLWHPVSMHNEERARNRAFEVLRRMALTVPLAPNDPVVINAEIDDLLEGDTPYFSGVVREGRLYGPQGTHWLPQRHLVEDALENWRSADFAFERTVIQSSLVSAYINDGWVREKVSLLPERGRGGDLEKRRREQAAQIVQRIMANAIYGEDGSVAWIAPALGATGWAVQPLQRDLYNGISGIALLLGAYVRETAAGRANHLDGVDVLLTAALHTLHLAEAERARQREEAFAVRPLPPGSYLGLGSQIWTYLMLANWNLDGGDGLSRACKLAEEIPAAAAEDDVYDVLSGAAGAMVPLLMLAHKTGDERYIRIASQLGDLLQERARRENGKACWINSEWPQGIGGFAHGVTGIGWALTQLARVTASAQHEQLAQEAFAFEDALFDEEEQNWLDLRRLEGEKTSAAWCHGAVGIGLAHLSLDPTLAHSSTRQIARRAAAATWRLGMGWNHCACHGDLGAWELLDRAITLEEAPKGISHPFLLDLILTSLEEHGPSCGMRRDAFAPGLLPGLGGIAYQLLRANPASDLPSILIPGGDELAAARSPALNAQAVLSPTIA